MKAAISSRDQHGSRPPRCASAHVRLAEGRSARPTRILGSDLPGSLYFTEVAVSHPAQSDSRCAEMRSAREHADILSPRQSCRAWAGYEMAYEHDLLPSGGPFPSGSPFGGQLSHASISDKDSGGLCQENSRGSHYLIFANRPLAVKTPCVPTWSMVGLSMRGSYLEMEVNVGVQLVRTGFQYMLATVDCSCFAAMSMWRWFGVSARHGWRSLQLRSVRQDSTDLGVRVATAGPVAVCDDLSRPCML